MTNSLSRLSPAEAHDRLAAGGTMLVDVREPDEFAREHIAGAVNLPLSSWDKARPFDGAADVIFTCRSGMRTEGACDRLAARVTGAAFMIDGGVSGWAKTGLPVERDTSAPLEIMRQVQIAAGALVLLGVLLGWSIHPAGFLLSAFVGAGLIFAGISGFCGMAKLLMLAPWNRRAVA